MKIFTFIALIFTLFFITACSQKKDMNNIYNQNDAYKQTHPITYDYVPLTPLRKIQDKDNSKYFHKL